MRRPFFNLTVLVACLCLGHGLPVAAASGSSKALQSAPVASRYDFQVAYEIYAANMHLLRVRQNFHMDATRYDSDLTASPTGFFSKLVPWQGRYAAHGTVVNGQLVPAVYLENSQWGDERTETVLNFNKRGVIMRKTTVDWRAGQAKPPARDVTPDPTLSGDAVDLVTAVLRMLQHAQTVGIPARNACRSAPVAFDGKRRFTMAFTDLGHDILHPSPYSAFSGLSAHCQIEIQPLAGFPRKNRGFYKIQEDSRKQGSLPALWLMPAWPASDTAPAGPPIPVRMLIKSQYGTILVNATKVTK